MGFSDWYRDRFTITVMTTELSVERDGKTVAFLDQPDFHEMFWFAWRITPGSDLPTSSPDALAREFWDNSLQDKTVFRCKRSGQVAHAFWAGTDPVWEGRLVLRGAYVPFRVRFREHPVLWLKLLLEGNEEARRRREFATDEKSDEHR